MEINGGVQREGWIAHGLSVCHDNDQTVVSVTLTLVTLTVTVTSMTD